MIVIAIDINNRDKFNYKVILKASFCSDKYKTDIDEIIKVYKFMVQNQKTSI